SSPASFRRSVGRPWVRVSVGASCEQSRRRRCSVDSDRRTESGSVKGAQNLPRPPESTRSAASPRITPRPAALMESLPPRRTLPAALAFASRLMSAPDMLAAASRKPTRSVPEVTILFAGDSGDGMQLTGGQFTVATARARNDLATLPDFPAEIRAPAGTTYGVSAFQLHFGQRAVHTPGDEVDLLVAMNAAALKVNLGRVRPGGTVIVNTNSFERRDLELAHYDSNPLEDGTLDGYEVVPVELTRLTREALADFGLSTKETDRSKNMFALGLALWLYTRPIEPARDWIRAKFAKHPEVRDANLQALNKGYHYGEITEAFAARYEVPPARLEPGVYRAVKGNEALALGLIAAGATSGLGLFYSTYPTTPASRSDEHTSE